MDLAAQMAPLTQVTRAHRVAALGVGALTGLVALLAALTGLWLATVMRARPLQPPRGVLPASD